LSYVLRPEEEVPGEVDNPAFGAFASSYGSLRDQIAARADHTTPQYQVDNAKVFELLNDAIGVISTSRRGSRLSQKHATDKVHGLPSRRITVESTRLI
jgi:hypothetical protein